MSEFKAAVGGAILGASAAALLLAAIAGVAFVMKAFA